MTASIHCWGVEGLEHDLCHLLTVGLGVEGGLSEQDWVLLRGNMELIVEGVMPDLFVKQLVTSNNLHCCVRVSVYSA